MKELLATILIAFVLLSLAALGLGISYVLTGKKKTIIKRCGNPESKKSKCDVCGKKQCTKKRDS